MGKVAVIANDNRGIARYFFGRSTKSSSQTYDDAVYTVMYCRSFQEIPTGFIETGRAFTPRGDKDCHHQSLSGTVFIDDTMRDPPLYEPRISPWFIDSAYGTGAGVNWYNGTEPCHHSGCKPRVMTYRRTPSDSLKYLTTEYIILFSEKEGFKGKCPPVLKHYEYRAGPTGVGPAKDIVKTDVKSEQWWEFSYQILGERRIHLVRKQKLSVPTQYSRLDPGPSGIGLYTYWNGPPYIVTETIFEVTIEAVFVNGEFDRFRSNYSKKYSRSTSIYGIGRIDRAFPKSYTQSILDQAVLSYSSSCFEELEKITAPETVTTNLKTKLIQDAIDDAKSLQVNSIALLRDLLHVKELFLPILKLKKKPLDPKSWANLWLTYDYGIRLLIQDLHEVVQKLPEDNVKSTLTHVRSMAQRDFPGVLDQDVTVYYHGKLPLSHSIGIGGSIVEKLRRLDLILSLENLWDFVPYSFVLDWFIPIGDMLSKLDLRNDIDLFGAKVVILSTKAQASLPNKILPIRNSDGDLAVQAVLIPDVKVYHRWHEKPTISLPDLEVGNGLNLHRAANGAALIVQKL